MSADKYPNKQGWRKPITNTNFVVPQPFKVDVWLIPNVTDYDETEIVGFLVNLYYNNEVIGQFHSVLSIDEDGSIEGTWNDVEIKEKWRGRNYGKALTLIAMDVSYENLGSFSGDTINGVLNAQQSVYRSLMESGAIKNDFTLDYDIAQKLLDKFLTPQ
jgi:ribosomal protein S18 acetylase RimI-like enzyme